MNTDSYMDRALNTMNMKFNMRHSIYASIALRKGFISSSIMSTSNLGHLRKVRPTNAELSTLSYLGIVM